MEQGTRLQLSRNAYKSHVTRQFKKAEELMASETVDELVLSQLKTSQELLVRKKETIHQLDTQIIELIQEADALEEAILDIKDNPREGKPYRHICKDPFNTSTTNPIHWCRQLSFLLHPLNMVK